MADNFNILDQNWIVSNLLDSGESVIDREHLASNAIPLSTGVLRLAYFTARKAEVISQVKMLCTGTAAGATPSLVRFGIWTSNSAGALLELVGSTTNDTALFPTQNTPVTKALTASFTKNAGQRYAFGALVVTAAAAPTTEGGFVTANGTEYGFGPRLSGVVTAQADLPATLAAGSVADSTSRISAILLP